jgi:hypothetical protein
MNSDSDNNQRHPAWPFGWGLGCASVDHRDQVPTKPNMALDRAAWRQGRTKNEAPPGNNLDLSNRSDLTQDRLPEDWRATIHTSNSRPGRRGRYSEREGGRSASATTSQPQSISSSLTSSASSIRSCLRQSSRAVDPRRYVCNPPDPFIWGDGQDESLGMPHLLRLLLTVDAPPPHTQRPASRSASERSVGGGSTLSFGDATSVISGEDTGESVDWQDTTMSLPLSLGGTSVANASEARWRPGRDGDRLHKPTEGRPQLERLDETRTARYRLLMSAAGQLEAGRRLDGTAERPLKKRMQGMGSSGSIRDAMRRQVPVTDAEGCHAKNQDWPATATTSTRAMALMAALASGGNGTAELATTDDASTTAKDKRGLTDPVDGGERAESSAGISEVARAESTCEGGRGVGSMGDIEDMRRPTTDAMGMRSLPTSLYGHANCFNDAFAIASQGQVVSNKVSLGSFMRPVRKGQAKNRRSAPTPSTSNIPARKPISDDILTAMNSAATSQEQCLDRDENFQKSNDFKEDDPIADVGNLMMLRSSIDLRKRQIEKHSTTDHDHSGTDNTVDEQSASNASMTSSTMSINFIQKNSGGFDVDQQKQTLPPSPCKNDQGQEVVLPWETPPKPNRNNPDARDLFSRFLEIKKKVYTGLDSLSKELALPGSLPSRNNVDVSLTRSSAPSTAGQLLVDWGDPCTEDDEEDYDQEYFSDDRCNNLMSSGPNELPNFEYSAGVNMRGWIAVNPDDVSMRRVSDLTTVGNDSDLNNTVTNI